MTHRRSVLAVAAAFGLYAAAPQGPQSTARRHVIEISGMKFTPSVLEVHQGDTVTWINRDIVPHTATEKGSAWDTGTITAGDSISVVLREAGAEEYFCRLHPVMVARMVVHHL